MKTFALLLFVVNVIAALAIAAFFAKYSVIQTAGGDEFVVVLSTQADECKSGGGCAVFSQREFFRAMAQAMRGRM